ncbi:MAG TPA: tRNA (cytidine(34)-2'-O)-methyltransferase [Alphaproteobacteria bacterium]|nr:tRNA (cytidine(34)-2'-O)-methyltransferase [Alphaproteobacteria bacterium]
MRVALYEPDIPQNTGAILRLAACLGVTVDVIEPTGFVMTDKRLRRAGLDYIAATHMQTHRSWQSFQDRRLATNSTGSTTGAPPRLVLLTTAGDSSHLDWRFRADDILMVGRESEGVPATVANACDGRIRIPIRPKLRSLNVATALAIVLGEALRQCGLYPDEDAEALRRINAG